MKTLVFGAAMVEMPMKLDRLPKSEEDAPCREMNMIIGGCAYNAASTLRNMGCEHDLCVPVGRGPYADLVSAELTKYGYDILIRDENNDNGFCLDLVEADGERTFITSKGIEGNFKYEWLASLSMERYDKIYVAGYQVCGEGGTAIAQWLSENADKQIFFAPGPVICNINSAIMVQIFSSVLLSI